MASFRLPPSDFDVVELAQSRPLLALLGAFVHASDRQRVEEYLELKKQVNIKMPYWVACFAIKNDRPCLSLNHWKGFGCNKHFCDYNHVCLVCGKDGHGMWQRNGRELSCSLLYDIKSQLRDCELDMEDFLNAIGRDPRLAMLTGRSTPTQLLRDLRDRNYGVVYEAFPTVLPVPQPEPSPSPTPNDEPREITYEITGCHQLKIVWNEKNIICRREQANSTVMEGTFFSFGLARPVAVKLVGLHGINEADRATEKRELQTHYEMFRRDGPPQFTVELFGCEDILLPDNFISGHHLAVVMERCAMNLAEWVMKNQERLNDRNTLREVVRQLLQAYDAWHKAKLFHRDVKPTNVLVKENSDGTVQLKLCDFDHSNHTQAGGTNSTLTEVGTCDDYGCWWSPKDRRVSDGKYERVPAESWPIGCMLHFIATGKGLFHYPGDGERSKNTAREAGDNEELRLEHLRQAGLHDNIPLLYDLVERMVRKRDALLLGEALQHAFLDSETVEPTPVPPPLAAYPPKLVEWSQGVDFASPHQHIQLLDKLTGDVYGATAPEDLADLESKDLDEIKESLPRAKQAVFQRMVDRLKAKAGHHGGAAHLDEREALHKLGASFQGRARREDAAAAEAIEPTSPIERSLNEHTLNMAKHGEMPFSPWTVERP